MKNCVLKIVISCFVFLYCCIHAIAVPAYPSKVRVVTANGKSVSIFMRGDEYHKFAVTEDGYTLISDSSGWWYANITDKGIVEKSDFRLMAAGDESEELIQFKADCKKGIIPENNMSNQPNRVSSASRVKINQPVVGERHALVILMQYKDVAFKKTREDFEVLFNTLEYKNNGATGSVRDYYRFASQGQLDYISDVYGPYTSKEPMRYYGRNSKDGGDDANPLELFVEAIKSLPNDIDFSIYDNDGDNLVDNVHIIFAGYGEEAGASADAIWSHEYPHRIILSDEVGYSFKSYSCSPELRSNFGSKITNIGVICHELGHALGAMDYYDTNYGTGGEYEGTGQWDIMASGSWNNNGKTPANFNPYVRSTVFGWNQQEILGKDQTITMPKIDSGNASKATVYRMNTGSDDDYYLLENRQRIGFDASLPGEGLIIYHVHPNIERLNSTNTINATHPQGLYPVCASYSEPSKKKYGNINSAECPFPGTKNVSTFASDSNPAAVAWNGSSADVALTYITMNPDGSVTFTTGEDTPIKPEGTDITPRMEVVYKESFEDNAIDRIAVSSILGKEKWQIYRKGDFITASEVIPKPTDGNSMLMLHASKSNKASESEAVGTEVDVDPGQNYTVSFDVYTDATSTMQTSRLNFLVEDEYGEYNLYSLEEPTKEWKRIELPLIFAGSHFRYKFYGRIYTGGIYIDNLKLYKEAPPSSVESADSDEKEFYVYGLNGTCVGKYGDEHELTPGLYIIRQGDRKCKLLIR